MSEPLREHLARILDWEEAHVGFDRAVDGIPADARGAVPPGFQHSSWQLLEHLRIAQADLLDFAVNPHYVHTRTWPDDYWPADPAPPDEAAWDAAVRAFRDDRKALKAVAERAPDLFASVPTGRPQQTVLRAILLVVDHNAYHLGQLVLVRRALGLWH
jgi:uncharacterized damage-inducible protein DinB